jgi:leucyl-tRNA synthetase
VVDEDTGDVRTTDEPADPETRRLLHRTIDAVRADMGTLEFNTAIARLFELNNRLTQVVAERGSAPAEVVHAMTLMVAPLVPHVAEELWEKLGHEGTLAHEAFPEADTALLVDAEVEIPVQIDGKVRAHVRVATGADNLAHEAAARADERVAALLDGRAVQRVVVVPGRLVNFVTR